MTQRKLTMAHGNWVEGDRFWGRQAELASFCETIDAGAHQLLIAQRRMGKTSLMRETARRLGDRYLVVFVDLQKCSSSPDVIVELSLALHPYKPLWKKLAGVFGAASARVFENIESVQLGEIGLTLRSGLTGEWQRRGDELLSLLADTDRPVLLLIDEAPDSRQPHP